MAGAAAASTVRLLDVEPGLATGLPAEELAFAQRQLVVPAVRLHVGGWQPTEAPGQAFAVFVLEGLILREDITIGRPDVELLGSGDVLDPRLFTDPGGSWEIVTKARLALIDDRAMIVARHCPGVVPLLLTRLFDGHREHHHLAAIRALPRADERLLALLGHMGSRWGSVTSHGTSLHLPVTHELLGRLVGIRRSTASLALNELVAHGLLRRPDRGHWLLPAPA